jgi:MoaA/NifB/PqqE/SkfB family radical SAM enzyme
MRNKQFWLDLAKVSRQFPNSKVDFAVDGLEDTHKLYRRKTIFSKLIENIKHFTSAQGNACMMMTVFKHNQHQIDDVKELAKETKCRTFVARRSHSNNMHIKTDTEDYVMHAGEVDQYKQQTRFDQGWNNSDIRDASVYGQINEQFSKLYEFAEDSKCPWYKDQEVQIDPWGVVWPCCHLSLLGIPLHKHILTISADNSIIEARKSNNLHKYSLTEVLYNEWFTSTVSNAVDNASWKICRDTCGVCK